MTVGDIAVMAYPQKIARDIVIGMARPINHHLVKLKAFDFPAETRSHFKRELRNWLDEIQRIRLKPTSRRGSFKFYFDPLFDYPFGGTETEHMEGIIDFVSSEYGGIRATKSAAEMVEWLRHFHTHLAERLRNGEDVLDLIPE